MKHECKACVCERTAEKEIDIYVPVAVKGFAELGEIRTKCEGCADIIVGTNRCPGKHDDVAHFVICQKVNIEVPVTFGAKTEVEEFKVDVKENCEKREDEDERFERNSEEERKGEGRGNGEKKGGYNENDKGYNNNKHF